MRSSGPGPGHLVMRQGKLGRRQIASQFVMRRAVRQPGVLPSVDRGG